MTAPYVAFTLKASQRLNAIYFDVGLTLKTAAPVAVDQRQIVKTLWDTSRKHTAITSDLYQKLKQNCSEAETLDSLDLYLPNNIRISDLPLHLLEPKESPYTCCIGMDIIALGDSAFSNLEGKSVFTFRIPSIQTLDFVSEQTATQPSPQKPKNAIVTAARNQRCPCGSGKKHKNCCAKR